MTIAFQLESESACKLSWPIAFLLANSSSIFWTFSQVNFISIALNHWFDSEGLWISSLYSPASLWSVDKSCTGFVWMPVHPLCVEIWPRTQKLEELLMTADLHAPWQQRSPTSSMHCVYHRPLYQIPAWAWKFRFKPKASRPCLRLTASAISLHLPNLNLKPMWRHQKSFTGSQQPPNTIQKSHVPRGKEKGKMLLLPIHDNKRKTTATTYKVYKTFY